MNVTVAICTWNRCELLQRTLEQMTRLRVPAAVQWELWVVDNNCTDRTAEVVASFSNRLPIRRIVEPTPGKSHACNRVLREVMGDLLLWTDDDVLVDDTWLEAFVVAATRYPDAAGFGGPIEPWFLQAPDADLCAAFPSLAVGFCGLDHDLAAGPIGGTESIWGANMGFRLDRIHGLVFKEEFGPTPASAGGGEDVDFLRQVQSRGGAIIWCPQMRLKHLVPPARMTLEYLKHYTRAKGREQARLYFDADRDRATGSFFGAPPWLWKEYAVASLAFCLNFLGVNVSPGGRLRSGPSVDRRAPRRVSRLVWLRERMHVTGIFQAYRSMPRVHAPTVGRESNPV
jgi:glycosyltransferase involved in cell wall biosynthesis